MSKYGIHIDRFDSADDIRGKQRTYEAVKARILNIGRFSCFEASQDRKSADIFTRLCRDPEIEVVEMGYPWTGIRRKQVSE
jgi:hypothetical protein